MKKQLMVSLLVFFTSVNLTKAQSNEMGRKWYAYERYQTCIDAMQQNLATNTADIDAWYWLIRSQLATNKTKEAVASFEKIPVTVQNTALIKVLKGTLQLYENNKDAANVSFQEALGTKRKKDPYIQLAIAQAIIDAPNTDITAAITLLGEAMKKEKNNPDMAMALGDAYRKLLNGSEAVKAYQQVIDADKNNAVAYYKIGKIYQTQNNVEVFTEYYNKSIQADPEFGQVYYPLYYYYYFRDVNKALTYLQQYIAKTDKDIANDYMLTDLYYVSQKYTEAIEAANQVIQLEGDAVKPRIYKLLAYSYDGLKDYVNAEKNLQQYFSKEQDTNYVAKDFDLMGRIAENNNRAADAAVWYEKAFNMEKDTTQKISYVKKLTTFYKSQKDYTQQANWMGKLYALHAPITNVDLFNWGIAWYNAQQYEMADSVFGIYATKYPEQSFGYYWRARSNAAIDTAMELGIAIPHYEQLIAVASKDTADANNRKWLIQAYGYIAAFKVNMEKKYDEALACYDKILALDPSNDEAEKYKGILEKIMESQKSH